MNHSGTSDNSVTNKSFSPFSGSHIQADEENTASFDMSNLEVLQYGNKGQKQENRFYETIKVVDIEAAPKIRQIKKFRNPAREEVLQKIKLANM